MKQLFHSAAANILSKLLRIEGKQRLSILIYHRVLPEADFMRSATTTVDQFEWQMALLAKHFNPLSLSEAVSLMDYGELPPRAVCVTFDDGYADNETVALPVLTRLGIPATIFVATGFLNGGRMWNDTITEAIRVAEGPTIDLSSIDLGVYDISSSDARRQVAGTIIREIKHWAPKMRSEAVLAVESLPLTAPLPTNLMLTDAQVKNLCNSGVEIGAHTINHPILATLDLEQAKVEIQEPKLFLESLTEKPVTAFAYPNGRPEIDYRVEHRDLVEITGYQCAFSTHSGVASKTSDKWQLPRFTPWDKTPLRFLVRLLLNFRNPS